ncbi:hypothetical protein [Corallococcus exercitus]|uniref:Uncharacterized protein n=1 Tax=Corallococcus exercitus TaxID=2316736 RepID=A0A7Y4JXE2_9BACT|nr:hypothetical protein [Corallococcus exercitus]NOK12928.1 hypothetical protein [Corallococcus exercitus]
MDGRRWMMLWLGLLPALAGAAASPDLEEPPVAEHSVYSLTRLEVTNLALIPRAGAGADEGFAGKLYVMGTGGTLWLPEEDGALRPGAFASVGLGVDSAR